MKGILVDVRPTFNEPYILVTIGMLCLVTGKVSRQTHCIEGREEWIDMWQNGAQEDHNLVALWVGNELGVELQTEYIRWKLYGAGHRQGMATDLAGIRQKRIYAGEIGKI